MKLAVVVVALILLSCLEPIDAQGRRSKVLRMCKSRFTNCLSKRRSKWNGFNAAAKCCGRAWTVCMIHKVPCLWICRPQYRRCMCKTGFSYYC